jgi:sulfite reductase (NADPH) hemoprotein beta-component
VEVAKAVLTIHRDFGDRTDRKHARLKYVVAERGVKFMQDEVNQRAGITLAPAKPCKFTTTADLLGWHKATDGKWFLGLFVETGRVKNAQKIALRDVAEKFPNIEFRLSANQNVILANANHDEKVAITALLATHRREDRKSGTRPARRRDGLSVAADVRPRPRGIGTHVARHD